MSVGAPLSPDFHVWWTGTYVYFKECVRGQSRGYIEPGLDPRTLK